MAATLNEALVQIIQSTQGAVEKGIGFLSDQIPDVIQQLLLWKFAQSLAYGALGALLMIALIILGVTQGIRRVDEAASEGKSRTRYKATLVYDKDGDVHPGVVFCGLVGVFGLPFSVSLMAEFFTALQIWLAPKVFLIEYASKLVS